MDGTQELVLKYSITEEGRQEDEAGRWKYLQNKQTNKQFRCDFIKVLNPLWLLSHQSLLVLLLLLLDGWNSRTSAKVFDNRGRKAGG